MNNKLRLVFSYYITLNNEISFIHKLHIALLKKYINIFNDIDFIILIDDVNNEDAINNHKSYIIEQLNRNDINFIIEKYDQKFKEGKIYVKYIIDRLNEYIDDLVFFGYTKGLDDKCLNNIENTKLWISLMYFMNFDYIDDVIEKLLDDTNYICYGTLYHNHHNSIISKYTWKYIGGYHWINPKRLLEYIDKNCINIEFVHKIDMKVRTSIETFLPNILDYINVAFLNDQIYNKDTNTLMYNHHNIEYVEILYCACMYLQYDDYLRFSNFYNNEIKCINI